MTVDTKGMIPLRAASGRMVRFDYLTDIEYNGEKYAVMLPLTGEEYVYVFRIKPDSRPNDRDRYLPVEDREALETVFGIFRERFKDEFVFEPQ